MNDRRVVISGVGVVSAYGLGKKVFWDGLRQGESTAEMITAFDSSRLPTRFAAPVSLPDSELMAHIEHKKAGKTMSRSGKFALVAAREAVEQAGLEHSSIDPSRFGTSLGTGGLGLADLDHVNSSLKIAEASIQPNGESFGLNQGDYFYNKLRGINPLSRLKALPNISTAHLAIAFNARGNCLTITTACTSGAQAVGEAYRQIRFGICDVMLSGGSDAMVNPDGLIAFSALGVLSTNNANFRSASRPFDKLRDGFMIGEGAAVFVLESHEHCRNRGAQPLAEILGYAGTSDAYRLTDEPPEAWGSIRAMELALEDAHVSPADIDYVNAHGTGTRMNDKTESHALKKVFGDYAYRLPVSSTKSMIGHLVAAAGAVELAACLGALEHQTIPPTINYAEPDPDCDLDYVPNRARKAKLETIMTNSFGFGGQNASLVIKNMVPNGTSPFGKELTT